MPQTTIQGMLQKKSNDNATNNNTGEEEYDDPEDDLELNFKSASSCSSGDDREEDEEDDEDAVWASLGVPPPDHDDKPSDIACSGNDDISSNPNPSSSNYANILYFGADVTQHIFQCLLDDSTPYAVLRLGPVCSDWRAAAQQDQGFWQQEYTRRWHIKAATFLSWSDMYCDRHDLEGIHEVKMMELLGARKVRRVGLATQEEASFRAYHAQHYDERLGGIAVGCSINQSIPSGADSPQPFSYRSKPRPLLEAYFEERNASLRQLLSMMAYNQGAGGAAELESDDLAGLRRIEYPIQAGWQGSGILNVDSFLELNRLRKSVALADYMAKRAMKDDPPLTSVRIRLIAEAQREEDERVAEEEAEEERADNGDSGSGSGVSGAGRRAVIVDITGDFFNVHQVDEPERNEAQEVADDRELSRREIEKLTCVEKVVGPIFLCVEEVGKFLGGIAICCYRCCCVIAELEEERKINEQLRMAAAIAIADEAQRRELMMTKRKKSKNKELEHAIDTATAVAIRLMQLKAVEDGRDEIAQMNLDRMREVIDEQVAEVVINQQRHAALRQRRLELERSVEDAEDHTGASGAPADGRRKRFDEEDAGAAYSDDDDADDYWIDSSGHKRFRDEEEGGGMAPVQETGIDLQMSGSGKCRHCGRSVDELCLTNLIELLHHEDSCEHSAPRTERRNSNSDDGLSEMFPA